MLWNSTLDAPVGLPIYVARAPRLHCISAAPAALDRYPRSVAGPCRSSRSLHSRSYPRSFTFYVGNPISSIPEFLINLPLPEIRNFGVGRWALGVERSAFT